MNAENRTDPLVTRIRIEMGYAVLFTAITLGLAWGMLALLPRFQEYLRDVDPELIHARTFEVYPDGGAIVYKPATGAASDRSIERYKQDLEILSRRFERGQFEMATLTGLRDSPILKGLLKNKADYSYRVETGRDMVVLRIKSRGGAATKALHEYLRFLEKHWIFHQ